MCAYYLAPLGRETIYQLYWKKYVCETEYFHSRMTDDWTYTAGLSAMIIFHMQYLSLFMLDCTVGKKTYVLSSIFIFVWIIILTLKHSTDT